jgi:hypothetical protein
VFVIVSDLGLPVVLGHLGGGQAHVREGVQGIAQRHLACQTPQQRVVPGDTKTAQQREARPTKGLGSSPQSIHDGAWLMTASFLFIHSA